MINELIEQIGGRERLEFIAGDCAEARFSEIEAMARVLLAVLDAQENPSAWIINCNSARINFAETEKTSVDKIIEECRENGTDIDITPLYTAPPTASAPEGWKLVPLKAFPSQWAAGQRAFDAAGINKIDPVYRAMVEAAPAPGGDDVKQG